MNTDKQNQHYIPKFYLRNFSYENNQKEIGVYNLGSAIFCERGKLKTQGSKKFFYGKDGALEERLSPVEDSLASLIRNIINTRMLPAKESLDHLELLLFAALTHLRNPVVHWKYPQNTRSNSGSLIKARCIY